MASRDADRVASAYDRASTRSTVWLVVAFVLGVIPLVAVQYWLARRSRRVLNLPALVATVALVVTLLASVALLGVAQGEADDVESGSYAQAKALGDARVAAFDAKANESLTLIARGSGTPADETWTSGRLAADLGLKEAGSSSALTQSLRDYATAHAAIRKLDNAGQWDAAVERAVATGPGSANAAFARFGTLSAAALAQAAGDTSGGLDDARGGLIAMAWLMVLVGLLAAGGAWWGISLRLDEYR